MEGTLRVLIGTAAEEMSAAFIHLAEPELPGAYRLAGFLLRDASEAEDATQEAILKGWLAWPRLARSQQFLVPGSIGSSSTSAKPACGRSQRETAAASAG